jgi:hypothetical protein
MSKSDRTQPAAGPELRPQPALDEGGPALRRPEEDIAHRPHLKVKPIGSRSPAGAHRPTVHKGTLVDADGAGADEGDQPARDWTPPNKVVLPTPGGEEVRFPFATHRPAPADEAAEEQELAAVTGTSTEREVSTGFLLGMALLVVVLIGGIWLVRLGRKVGSLERRLSRLEAAEVTTAQLPHDDR